MSNKIGLQLIKDMDTKAVEVRIGFSILEADKAIDLIANGLAVLLKNKMEICEDLECEQAILNDFCDCLFKHLDEITDTSIVVNDK